MSHADDQLVFAIYQGNRLVDTFEGAQPFIKIGKLSSSHIRLDDPNVSRMHAVIERRDDSLHIIDLGSSTGTLVNGQKINRTSLTRGDEVVVGDTRIVVQSREAQARTVPRPAAPTTQISRVVTPNRPPPPASQPAAARSPAPPSPPPAPMPSLASPVANANALEVTTRFHDSVVGVRYLTREQKGRTTRTTRLLLAIGCAALLLSLVGFTRGVVSAQANADARAQWQYDKLPMERFRPQTVSAAYDWLAFGGLALGLGCLFAGLWRQRDERIRPDFIAGTDRDVDATCDSLGARFPLISRIGDEYHLNINEEISGTIKAADGITTLDQLRDHQTLPRSHATPDALAFVIPPACAIEVQCQHTVVTIREATAPARQPVPLFTTVASSVAIIFAASLIFHLGFWGILQHVYDDIDGGWDHTSAASDVDISASTKPDREQDTESRANKSKPAAASTGGASKAGHAGEPGNPSVYGSQPRRTAVKDRNRAPAMSRSRALTSGKDAAVAMVGELAFAFQGNAFQSSGHDAADYYGGLDGEPGNQDGFGTAAAGIGPGAGCPPGQTNCYGPGRSFDYDRYGPGNSDDFGPSKLPGPGGWDRTRKAGAPIIKDKLGDPAGCDAEAGCRKDLIRRYVRLKARRYRHCYERELLVNPDIEGQIMINFTIGPRGRVLVSLGQGFNQRVADCVAKVIATIRFPEGPLAAIRYPFHFSRQR